MNKSILISIMLLLIGAMTSCNVDDENKSMSKEKEMISSKSYLTQEQIVEFAECIQK